MATALVGAAAAGGAFTAVPYVGWAVGIAAALIDQTIIYPALLGDEEEAQTPQLASLPTSEQGVGSPRTFALGTRIRVPAHILYQSSKVRESQAGGGKGGTSVTLKRVYVNALIHLNDRRTAEMTQLIGNGQLVLYKSRSLIRVQTENMTVDLQPGSGGTSSIRITMGSVLDPDLTESFVVGDIIIPNGFIRVTGPDPEQFNDRPHRVVGIQGHIGNVPSTMTMLPMQGEDFTNLSMTGGTTFSPAELVRADDHFGGTYATANAFGGTPGGLPSGGDNYDVIVGTEDAFFDPRNSLAIGQQVWVYGLNIRSQTPFAVVPTYPVPGYVDRHYATHPTAGAGYPQAGKPAVRIQGIDTYLDAQPGVQEIYWPTTATPPSGAGTLVGTRGEIEPGNNLLVIPRGQQLFTTGVFPPDFDPDEYYRAGEDDQNQPPILTEDFGTGETSHYRGMATQGLAECYVSLFGDQLPQNLEAILSIDDAMSWAQAIEAVLQRGGLNNTQIGVSGIRPRPFRGAMLRGSVSVAQQIQPLLIAGQLLAQDRDGVLEVFDLDSADSVQLENGSQLSDIGVTVNGAPAQTDRVQIEDVAQADMPTKVSVRFQDPDNALNYGYECFGLRNPGGVDHENEQRLEFSNMVLSRRDARDLTATVLRRAWVNRRRYRLTLPVAYMHLLENDLITWTDDTGEDVVARIIQRDIGSDYTMRVTAVRERTNLAVTGSPAQPPLNIVSQNPPQQTQSYLALIDGPAIANTEISSPSVRIIGADISGQGSGLATIWESREGAPYIPVGTLTGNAAVGILTGTLSAQTASEEYGTTTVSLRSQTVDVVWLNEGTDPIAACTQAQAETGTNWCAIVNAADPTDVEIAAFTTVSNTLGTYTLGGWLRGLRGTNPKARDTQYLIVMLTQSTDGLEMIDLGATVPSSVSYKLVPTGSTVSQVDPVTLSPTKANVLPLPVRQVTKSYNATTLTTRFFVEDNSVPTHWQRAVLPLGTQPPHTLDEPFEAYRIKFYSSVGFDVLVDEVVIDSRNTGTPTLRDRYFDWPDARATYAGYTPSASPTYNIGVVHIGQHGEGPEAQFTV